VFVLKKPLLKEMKDMIIFWSPVATFRTTRLNVTEFTVLPTECIYILRIKLRRKSGYYCIH